MLLSNSSQRQGNEREVKRFCSRRKLSSFPLFVYFALGVGVAYQLQAGVEFSCPTKEFPSEGLLINR